MVDWYPDHGLDVLIHQMKWLYPGLVVGTIGDKAHQREKSDHNPDPDGSVDAADFMLDTRFTFAEAQKICSALARYRDQRLNYFIFNRKIWQTGEWRDYKGTDPHTNHLHVSVNDLHTNDTSSWTLTDEVVSKLGKEIAVKLPMIGQGDDDAKLAGLNVIKRIQTMKHITADGVWGPQTTEAVGGSRLTEQMYRSIFGLN